MSETTTAIHTEGAGGGNGVAVVRQTGNDSPATQGTAAGSAGVALAVAVIIVWVLSLFHITMPDNVAAAMATILTVILHWIGLKVFKDN